jgi:hypothetical protein
MRGAPSILVLPSVLSKVKAILTSPIPHMRDQKGQKKNLVSNDQRMEKSWRY